MGADTGDKTEDASDEKLRKSKEEGQVPKSQDFVAALGFGAGFMTLVGLLAYIFEEVEEFTHLVSSPPFANPPKPRSRSCPRRASRFRSWPFRPAASCRHGNS